MPKTQSSEYDIRKKVWDKAFNSFENHIKLGQTLQAQGIEIIKSAQTLKNDDLLGLSNLIKQATIAIEKGTKIEGNSYNSLIKLQDNEPRL